MWSRAAGQTMGEAPLGTGSYAVVCGHYNEHFVTSAGLRFRRGNQPSNGRVRGDRDLLHRRSKHGADTQSRVDARYWTAITLASVFGTNMGTLYAHESGLGILEGLAVLPLLALIVFIVEGYGTGRYEVYHWLIIILPARESPTVRTTLLNGCTGSMFDTLEMTKRNSSGMAMWLSERAMAHLSVSIEVVTSNHVRAPTNPDRR